MMQNTTPEYRYHSAESTWANQYLWPELRHVLRSHVTPGAEIFDLGCGSGATAAMLSKLGYSITAVDLSTSGIQLATNAYPHIRFTLVSTLGRRAYQVLVGKDFAHSPRGKGLVEVQFLRVGRIPPFAKSMIALARKAK